VNTTAAAAPRDWWTRLPGLVAVGAHGRARHLSPPLQALCHAAGVGSQWWRLFEPVSQNVLCEGLQSTDGFQLELQRDITQAPSGEWHSWSCAARWLPDEAIHLCVLVETSAVRQAEQQARSHRQFLHTFCNALPIMMAYYDHEMRCLYANRSYAGFHNLTETSILGMSAADVQREADRSAGAPREPVQVERGAMQFERKFVGAEGVRWLRGTLQPLLDPQGRRIAGAAMNQDVTDRHLTEQALEASEERLSRFMEASTECVVFHSETRITDANPAACRIYGTELPSLLGRSVLDFVSPEHLGEVRRRIDLGVEGLFQSELINARGDRIAIEVTGRSMLRNSEKLRMVVLRDIRDRQEAQAHIDELIASLRAQKDRAEAADRAKSVFLAAASHDLRQPIHALGLFLTALRSMAQTPAIPSSELVDICHRMQSSLDSLGQLLNMLLDVSRLDANAVQIVREPTELAALLDELGQEFAPLAREKGLQLRVACTDLWVDTDPTVLRRILANLLSNAVRYTPRGRVLLGCRRRGSEVEIQVWDSGIGIAPEQREAIFEEFYQVGQSTAQHHEAHGLGLGLPIVRRSAHLLQAPLDLCSQPGLGSMFSIRLPRCEAPVRTPQPEPALHPSAHGLGVLVIDDDAQVLGAMQRVLSVWGHRAFCAASADEAVIMAITHPDQIHLLLSDYRLGATVTAVDAIRAVQACLPHPVPTYILTGDTSPQRIHEASLLGFPLLHKPLQAAVLRGILDAEVAAASALA
jgi:PAS domain S-box-containing protein